MESEGWVFASVGTRRSLSSADVPVGHGGAEQQTSTARSLDGRASRLYFIDLRIKIIWIKSLGSYSDFPIPAYLQNLRATGNAHGCSDALVNILRISAKKPLVPGQK